MARRILWMVLAACTLAVIGDEETAVRELDWGDLLPDDQPTPPMFVDHSGVTPLDDLQIPTSVVPELNGQMVKISGFIVPLDLVEGKVSSSLLVPYFGACIHVPPPPANQIVHVKFEEPIEIGSIWDPVWVTGKLGLERYASDIAEAGYSLDGQGIEEYRY